MSAALLAVRDLAVSYVTAGGRVPAVRGARFSVGPGEAFGIVGESGSGKSTIALAALRLLRPNARVERGELLLDGVDLLRLSEAEMRRVRWRDIALVPQASLNALNPVLRVEEQIADAIVAHEGSQPRRRLRERVLELLASVRLSAAVARRYPHELSGGMRQRVCIAMAVALAPRVLIADEPTSALDVVVQRAVAEVLLEATERLGAALVLIGHDLALQAQLVDRLAVMRAGRVVEVGPARALFREPAHPYTRLLLASLPAFARRGLPLPAEALRPSGCVLGAACPGPVVGDGEMHEIGPGHLVACLAVSRDGAVLDAS